MQPNKWYEFEYKIIRNVSVVAGAIVRYASSL